MRDATHGNRVRTHMYIREMHGEIASFLEILLNYDIINK